MNLKSKGFCPNSKTSHTNMLNIEKVYAIILGLRVAPGDLLNVLIWDGVTISNTIRL